MPHYERFQNSVGAAAQLSGGTMHLSAAPDDLAMQEAAEALRQTEVEAAEPDIAALDAHKLEHMSIDELRAVANALDVPDRAQITEKDELIEAIRQRL